MPATHDSGAQSEPQSPLKMQVWQAPSGRYHKQGMCTGGAGKKRMHRVSITEEQYEVALANTRAHRGAPPSGTPSLCACAWKSGFKPGQKAR